MSATTIEEIETRADRLWKSPWTVVSRSHLKLIKNVFSDIRWLIVRIKEMEKKIAGLEGA